MSKYSTLIYKLPKSTDNILVHDADLELSHGIEYPKFSLGFQHYIHQSKDKINIFSDFKDKKKVYLVLNKFEKIVDDYDKSIDIEAKKYFNLKSDFGIIGRSFYKFWEILMSFNLSLENKPITTAHIADRGTSLQAISCYRNLFAKNNKDDKHYVLSMNKLDHMLATDSELEEHYKKDKSSKIIQINSKDEIFDEKSIKDKIDLIMAYTGYGWTNKNVQEQEAHRLLLNEIIIALKIQNKGGNFICKIYESYTKTTLKLISILLSTYENVYIIKPFMSRLYNSEKFLVCMNFTGANNKEIEKLETVLQTLLDNNNKSKKIAQIFPKFKLDDIIKDTFIKLNTEISNNQFININEIMDFLNKQNYRGDVYHQRKDMQINASEFWISRFFNNNQNNIIDENNKIIANNEILIKQLTKSIN